MNIIQAVAGLSSECIAPNRARTLIINGQTTMKKTETNAAIKRRDFLKAGAVAGAVATLEGAGEVLRGADDRKNKVYMLPNVSTPNRPVIRNAEICNGCNTCVNICQVDVYVPNPLKGKPPITLHPDECWYCGCCVNECPRRTQGAIKFNWPLQQRGFYKRKATGEIFRV
jgi:NAD-dependent dihydropyrimidine dehydrogenase PreA subunit